MAGSPKVTASAVGAAASTVVTSILAHHLFHGSVPADVLGLVEATITAGVTYGAGYLTKHVPAPVLRDAETVVKDVAAVLPSTAVADVPLEAPVPSAGA